MINKHFGSLLRIKNKGKEIIWLADLKVGRFPVIAEEGGMKQIYVSPMPAPLALISLAFWAQFSDTNTASKEVLGMVSRDQFENLKSMLAIKEHAESNNPTCLVGRNRDSLQRLNDIQSMQIWERPDRIRTMGMDVP
jgi:hypothetical protein